MAIKSYSTTPSSNNSAPPNGFPEGMAPASLNDGMRQVMADIRSWYEDPAWIDLGDTPTYVSTTSFTLSGDKTGTYVVGRRIRAIGTTPFTIYGVIATSTFSSPNTTVTVTWDSGTLNATLNAVALNLVQASLVFNAVAGSSLSITGNGTIGGTLAVTGVATFSNAVNTAKGADIASATTTDIGAATGNFVHITGTTTITGLGTAAAGIIRAVRFAGALTLTHNATSLILPSGANITTAANDTALFVSEGSGNWRCLGYERASGSALNPNSSLSAAVALTSGTTKDIAIPTGVRQFTVSIVSMSYNASAQPTLLLGTAGSFETSGYSSICSFASTAVGTAAVSTAVILTTTTSAATVTYNGSITFTLVDESTNEWSWDGTLGDGTIPATFKIAGSKALSGALTRIQLTSAAGTATFDNGKASVFGLY